MKKTTGLVIVLGLLVLVQGGRIVRDSGMLLSVTPLEVGQCEPLLGPVGAEDMTVDRISRVAYISADDRHRYITQSDHGTPVNGGIWMLNLSQPNSHPVQLQTGIEGPFHPHGMALRYGPAKALELYVLNHINRTTHEIVVFELVEPDVLKLRRRISYPEMYSPNDLVVLGQDKFLLSNDHGNPRGSVMEKLEDYLGLPLSSVSYFDGQKGHIVIEGLRMANGLALAPDQQTLYVAETTGRRISKFTKGNTWIDWQWQESIDVDSGVDNLEWDQQGQLLTGAHPKLFDFLAHMHDPEALSPSEVIRINVAGKSMTYETVYRNTGEALSGSSVAVQSENTLLIGSVFEPQMLRCQIDKN